MLNKAHLENYYPDATVHIGREYILREKIGWLQVFLNAARNFIVLPRSFSGILFMENIWAGLVVLGVMIFDYNMVFTTVTSMLVLIIFIYLIGFKKSILKNSYFIYNSLLVGLAIGFIFELSANSVFFVAAASILTFLLTICLNHFLSTYKLPVLSLPFAIISCCIYLAANNYSNLFSLDFYQHDPWPGLYAQIPLAISVFFSSLGSIFFMPYPIAGIFIFLAIIIYSRILAFQAVTSFYFGIFIHSLLVNSIHDSLLNPYNFNYILVGMALGGVFLIASIRTFFISLTAVAVCVLLIDMTSAFTNLYHIPIFTIPFNITVILFVLTMRLLEYRDYNYCIRRTPEDSLLYHLTAIKRFKKDEISIGLPIAEKTKVYQAFDGQWTHKNHWRYAYDFVQTDDGGNMFENNGTQLSDYFIFNKEIVAPVSGYVSSCRSDLPDNQPGVINNRENWGNFIIIKSPEGFFVEISHLKNNSLKVKTGEYIYRGQVIASCGNSGFSTFPHIHLQVQKIAWIGAETVPFNFYLYKKGTNIHIYDQPSQGDIIGAVDFHVQLAETYALVPGTKLNYQVCKSGNKIDVISVTVKRENTINGLTYLEDEKGSKLYYTLNNGAFYFYDFTGRESSWLKLFYLAVPHFPLSKLKEYSWNSVIPVNIPYRGIIAKIIPLASLLNITDYIKGEWNFKQSVIYGSLYVNRKILKTKAVSDQSGGWKQIEVNKISLMKIDKTEDLK